jgi:hypothetical protein
LVCQARAFGERGKQHRPAGSVEHGQLSIVERIPPVLIDEKLEHRLGLVPPRHIDELRVILKALALVDCRGEELRAVDLMLVEGLANLPPGTSTVAAPRRDMTRPPSPKPRMWKPLRSSGLRTSFANQPEASSPPKAQGMTCTFSCASSYIS